LIIGTQRQAAASGCVRSGTQN